MMILAIALYVGAEFEYVKYLTVPLTLIAMAPFAADGVPVATTPLPSHRRERIVFPDERSSLINCTAFDNAAPWVPFKIARTPDALDPNVVVFMPMFPEGSTVTRMDPFVANCNAVFVLAPRMDA
jgi:hypothetical protein